MAGVGHNIGEADDRLKNFFDRIRSLDEEREGIVGDIKDIYTEAKALGYDTKIMRQVYRRMKMSRDERMTLDEMISTYERAIGLDLV